MDIFGGPSKVPHKPFGPLTRSWAVSVGLSKVPMYWRGQLSFSWSPNLGMLSLQGTDHVFGSDRRGVAKDDVAYAQFQLVVETTNPIGGQGRQLLLMAVEPTKTPHSDSSVVTKGCRHLGKGRGNSRWRKWPTLTFHWFLGETITRQSLSL